MLKDMYFCCDSALRYKILNDCILRPDSKRHLQLIKVTIINLSTSTNILDI